MKAFRNGNGWNRLIGRAEIPDDAGHVYEVYLSSATSTIVDAFKIDAVTHLGPGAEEIEGERAVLVALCKRPETLPG